MTERDSPPPLVPDTALVERVVGRVLFWGGLLSIGVLIAGLVLYAARGDYRAHAGDLRDLRQQRTGQAAHVVLSLGQLVRGLAQHPIDPVTIMTLGVVVLLAVPVAGVDRKSTRLNSSHRL